MKTATSETLSIFAKHSWQYKSKIITLIVCSIITVLINAMHPLILKNLVDIAYINQVEAKGSMMLLVYLLVAAHFSVQMVWRVAGFVNNRFQPQVMVDLSRTGFEYILSHSQSFYENNFVGSLVAKLKRYPSSFERVADVVCWNFIPTAILIISYIGVMTYFWFWVGIFVLVWAVVYVGFSYKFSQYKLQFDILAAEQDTATTALMADVVSNNSNIHLFASRNFEIEGFKAATELLRKFRLRSWDLTTKGEIFQNLSTTCLMLGTMSLAVYYHKQGKFSGAEFVLLYIYLRDLSNCLWELGRNIRTVYSALADANEMTEILKLPHELPDRPLATDFLVRKGAVTFRNVKFTYPGQKPILSNFSLEIEAGEKIALVGESGSGKPTLIKLLCRNMDVNDGAILIDGLDIRDIKQDSLHNAMSLVPQSPDLFHRSVLDNIRYNRPDSSFAEVMAAAKAARCEEFISELVEGYDTLVGERGIKLSGGQKQRVAIARAFLRNSPILILDEATSSLDSESEKYIQEALHNLMKGKTTIVVAHRLSTIKEMDRIIVIRNGVITEEGTHDSLLAKGGEYALYWNIQSGGFIREAACG